MSDQSSVALRVMGPRATLLGGGGDALNGINTTTLPDGSLCYVTAPAKRFGLHRDSVLTPDGTTIIEPLVGPGRWIVEDSGGTITIPFPVAYIDATAIPDGQVVQASGGIAVWGAVPTAFEITSFALGVSSLVQVGSTVTNPTFTASYNQVPTSVVLTDTEGNTDVVTSTPNAFTSPHAFTKSTFGASVTFTDTASTSLGSDAATASLTWGQKVFYGAAVAGTYNEAFIEALSGSALKTSPNGNYAINATVGKNAYFGALTALGLTVSDFFVGGFPFACSKVASAVSVTNTDGVTATYDLFGSDNTGLGSFTLSVS